jgi:hypothetical protein
LRQHDWIFVFIPSPQTRPRLEGFKAVRLAIREFDHSGCSNGGSGKANIAYLISHPRPMAEVLRPRRKDIAGEFRRGFVGMTLEPVSLDELIAAPEALITIIVDDMPTAHRDFLIGFKRRRTGLVARRPAGHCRPAGGALEATEPGPARARPARPPGGRPARRLAVIRRRRNRNDRARTSPS